MIVISILVFIIYSILIFSFIIGFDKVKLETNNFGEPINTFSIVIPFRNESINLENLLISLLKINYPKNLFEILLVNDASIDDSSKIIEIFIKKHPTLNVQLIENLRESNSPKKDAINTAINISKFDWIVTTDADCEVPINWLQCFNSFIDENQSVFISAPVKFKQENSFLFHFQNLNFISLIGSTIGSFGIKKPFMCNGANLCYKKEIFQQLNGFEGNTNIASGDDIFLLEKMVFKYPTKTSYLKSKEAIVSTQSEKSWNSFFNQQLRWASKSGSYKNWFSKFVGLTIFTTNLAILIFGLSLFFQPNNWMFFIGILLQKMFFDILLIEKTAVFLNSKKSLQYYPLISVLYPFYIVLIATFSMFKNYEWKGRKFSK